MSALRLWNAPVLVLGCLLALVVTGCERDSRAGAPSAAPARPGEAGGRQIYLAEGGRRCLVLEGAPGGEFKVLQNTLPGNSMEYPVTAEERTVYGTRALTLRSTLRLDPRSDDLLHMLLVMTPDPEAAGDWHITYLQEEFQFAGKPAPALQIPENLKSMPSGPYLHRVDDERAAEYFRIATAIDLSTSQTPVAPPQSAVAGRLLALAEELKAKYPSDLYVRTLLLDALLRSGNLDRLGEEVNRIRPEAQAHRDRAVSFVVREAERQIQAHRLGDRNGIVLARQALRQSHPFPDKLRLFSELFQVEDARTTAATLLKPGFDQWVYEREGFLPQQVRVKVARVLLDFLLLQGKRAEARALGTGFYRAARLFQNDTTQGEIQALVGIALRAILASHLQIHAANAVQTTEEALAFWRELDRLDAGEREPEEFYHLPCGNAHWKPGEGTGGRESQIRDRVSSAKFQLVRLTLATRYHQLQTGQLPPDLNPLRHMFPNGLPRDTFTSAPLRLTPGQNQVTLYSVGPDERDDRGELTYDPTNGTVSPGDVLVRIPFEREFPFPPDGVRASSAGEVARQFPRGLPPDPFSDSRRDYAVTEAPGPVYVFSWGPDTDESRALGGSVQPGNRSVGSYVPTIPYDPTNGTVSPGDIFLRLPASQGR